MALFALAEWAALGILFSVLRDLRDVKTAKRIVILYLTSPVYLSLSCTWAQDEPLCLLAVAALLWSALRKSEWAAILGMGLVAGVSLFFTKILVVYYLAPFLLLRRMRGAVAAVALFAVYLAVVKVCGVNPFDFVFGRSLGLAQGASENVLDFFSGGNIWSVMHRPVPHEVSGAVCFAALSLAGLLFAPAMLRSGDVRERFSIAVEWTCAWIFVFNIFYTMTFATYILPVVPFLAILWFDRRGNRPLACFGLSVFAVWMILKLLEIFVMWMIRLHAGGTGGGFLGTVILDVTILLLSSTCLGLVLYVSRGRFEWLTRRLFPEEVTA